MPMTVFAGLPQNRSQSRLPEEARRGRFILSHRPEPGSQIQPCAEPHHQSEGVKNPNRRGFSMDSSGLAESRRRDVALARLTAVGLKQCVSKCWAIKDNVHLLTQNSRGL